MTDIRNETSTIVAALNCLPLWMLHDGAKDILEDNSRALVKDRRLDITSMAVLDAFAAICVYRPFDAYAVTYEVRGSNVVLYIASTSRDGVPSEARYQIQLVWRTMKTLAAHPDSQYVRETNTITPDLKPIHSEFIAQVYRFSWPALAHRFRSVADTTIRQLDHVLNDNVERTPLVDCDVKLTERERTLCLDIRSALAKARKSVLVDGLDTNYGAIHNDLGDLRVLLKGHDALTTLGRLDKLAATALSRDIRSLVWLGVPIDTLRTFAHSQAFAELCKLDLDIVPLAPLTADCGAVHVNCRDLTEIATIAYKDKGMRAPEPNFAPDFTAYIMNPLRQRYPPEDHGLSNDSADQIPVHAECALLVRFASASVSDSFTAPFISYIGTSEPCCLPCYRYIDVVNKVYGIRGMHVRGSDGHVPNAWAAGEVYMHGIFADARPLAYALASLRHDFGSAVSVLRQHLARVRKMERLSRGEPLLTPEEEQYRNRAAVPAVPYWLRPDGPS